ncbi:hypothetical protein IJJ27_01160 [bacterium]|nr:hypothetical protein [bacterium]
MKKIYQFYQLLLTTSVFLFSASFFSVTASTVTCPHGKFIANQWVKCYTCPSDGYLDYNLRHCACNDEGKNFIASSNKCFACPAGSSYDNTNFTCVCPHRYATYNDIGNACSCPEGMTWRSDLQMCILTTCPEGYAYSSTLVGCYKTGGNCDNPDAWMPLYTGCAQAEEFDTACLVDPRDYQTYRSRKFADGTCWLVDELAFGGDYGQTYGCAGVGNFPSSAPLYSSACDSYSRQYFSSDYYGHCASASDGVYYDAIAAWQNDLLCSIGWGPQPTIQGICPSGWHIPIVYTDSFRNDNGDYKSLATQYGTAVNTFWLEQNKWNGKKDGYFGSQSVLHSTVGFYLTNYKDAFAPVNFRLYSITVDYYFTSAIEYAGVLVRCLQDYCQPGTYVKNGQCQACPTGATSATKNARGCTCASGQFFSNDTCMTCPAGAISSSSDPTTCDCQRIGYQHNPATNTCEATAGVYSPILDVYYDNTNCSDPVAWMDQWAGCSNLDTVINNESVSEQELAAKTVCLLDPRDHRSYRVRRFDDDGTAGQSSGDQCWMIDSLRFGGNYGEIDGCSANSGEGNFTYAWCGGSSASGCTSGGSRNATQAQETFSQGFYGHCRQTTTDSSYFYDWVAAMQSTLAYQGSATAFDAPQQGLCPTGWHLPSGGSSGEFKALATNYGTNGSAVTNFWTDVSKWNGSKTGDASYTTGDLDDVGSKNYYWSSTKSANNYAYTLYLYTTVGATTTGYKGRGHQIRCIKD